MKSSQVYQRTFILQSCHFNSRTTYDKYESACSLMASALETGTRDIENAYEAAALLKDVVKDIHGHNFKVQITAECDTLDQGAIVWDEALEALVRQWDRTNLSVHPDITPRRATTEVLCMVLKRNLEKAFSKPRWEVVIWETDEIMAVAR